MLIPGNLGLWIVGSCQVLRCQQTQDYQDKVRLGHKCPFLLVTTKTQKLTKVGKHIHMLPEIRFNSQFQRHVWIVQCYQQSHSQQKVVKILHFFFKFKLAEFKHNKLIFSKKTNIFAHLKKIKTNEKKMHS